MQVLVEVAAASVDDVLSAQRGGAARVELSCALELGGLTPSLGILQEAKRQSSLPVFPMLRPRAAGFCYSHAEFETILRDLELFRQHGADGLVFGVLHPDGTIDTSRCRALISAANGLPCVFHRAFDVTPDPLRALEELIDLGITRILTSGQQPTAHQGAGLIRQLVERGKGRIEILPGSGVRPNNVAELVAQTGCTQVHLSARTTHVDHSTNAQPQIKFSNNATTEGQFGSTDEAIVRATVQALAAIQTLEHESRVP